MYISELVIHGFKSFNSKHKLDFGEGIAAVVGPNGCGKTNIVDAIRWVLGEQKYSTLRTARMEDIIFNGAKGTKPMSVCEVYLTVHNDTGTLPVEYTDVEIGRRLYRDGESEYFLNRTPCRLKDIHNLFVDTGMGADSYSVIELKMIEQILSESDDGRKHLFEEAAGINKYKNQRRLSIKKFEATRFDLERINDIINEVDVKVRGLNLQLKRFKRHATLVEQLKNNEIDFGTLQIRRFLQASEPLQKKIDEFSHLREEKFSAEDLNESELKRLRSLYDEQVGELNTIRKQLSDKEANREDARQNILIWQEQTHSAETNIERMSREFESNKSRIKNYSNSILQSEKEVKSIIPKIDERLSNFKLVKEKFEAMELAYKTKQNIVDDIQNERWNYQKQMSEDKSQKISTESLIKDRSQIKDKLSKRISSEKEAIENLKNKDNTYQQQHQEIESQLHQLQNLKSEVEGQADEVAKNLNVQNTQKQSQTAKLDLLSSQLEFYKDLIISQTDLPEGLKFVIKNQILHENVIGTVADIFNVEDKYEVAINAALGDLTNCLICKNRKSAVEILKEIQNQKAGNVAIIPLKEVQKRSQKFLDIPQSKLVIGKASDFISSQNEYDSIAEMLLGSTLIVNDLTKAINDSQLSGWNLVDLSGVSYSDNLVLKNTGRSKGSAIGRKEKVETLKTDIEKLQNAIQLNRKDLNQSIDKKVKLQRKISELNSQISSKNSAKDKLDNNYQKTKFEIENKKKIVTDSKNELQTMIQSVNDLQNALKSLNKNVQKHENKLSVIQKKLDDANEKLIESRTKRDSHHQAVQDMRIDLLNLENKRDNLNLQKKTTENTISEIEERQNAINNDISSLKDNIANRISQIKEKEKELTGINAELQKKKSILELKEQTYRDTYRAIEDIETKIKSEQKNRESILEELKQCEIEIVEYQQRIKAIKVNVVDRYQATVPRKENIEKTEDELRQDIGRLERSIESIGPVNMAVQTEYEDETKRMEHLIAQRDDLIAAEENLRQSIEKIDRIARRQFRDTFDQIKTNFENLFTVFFEGGQGTLELIGDPDPLDADIAIKAQPPGKRNQTLRMLSAGEKSLTAIALLFSIYQYKPSPFCILDEVDAPLDDINVGKFTRALKSFTKDTQFIVVTHNKQTMEAANYLYGITMEKKGISKLVSVKFD